MILVVRFFLTMTLLTFIASDAIAQLFPPFPQGLGFEIGTGHNQLLFHVYPDLGLYPESDYSREEFRPTPTLRIRYELSPLTAVQVLTFVGYNQFGGRSKTKSTGYKDEYWVHALEMGVVLAYSVGDLRAGVGVKYNRHFNVTTRYYGTLYQTTPRTWESREDQFFLKRNSADIGPRISWVFSHWSVSGEAWFGVTNLQRAELDQFVRIRENHYRLLVGYTL
jgi:hypothetical protein